MLRIQEQAGIAALIRRIRDGYAERFTFSMANMQRNVSVARGEKPQSRQRVTLEKRGDRILLMILGKMGNQERQRSLMVVLRTEGGEPIVREAFWDEACGQYVAAVDGTVAGENLEIYVIGE